MLDSPRHGWLRGSWGLSYMTLADWLRFRNKALKVEELADLLDVAIRSSYKEVQDNADPIFSQSQFDPLRSASDGWAGREDGRNNMRQGVTIKTAFSSLRKTARACRKLVRCSPFSLDTAIFFAARTN